MESHDRELAQAFDAQAERFETAPVQSDPAALAGLVAFAALPAGARVLDAGCGPGLVAEAFLGAGCELTGVDLSAEMVRRARARCARFGARARFEQGSALDLAAEPFDAAVSRLVLHHVTEPLVFLRAQVARVRPGGVVVACDRSGDPEPERARWSDAIERARDRTHIRCLSGGELVDLFAAVGLSALAFREESFQLDFDEWFDRGTPALPKDEVRRSILAGTARGFEPVPRPDGGLTLRCWRALVRGVKA
jgi:2-polyprenyl-3-methyl-5-hydroxy-6-metoxy-1,4-benzoquinol methylase